MVWRFIHRKGRYLVDVLADCYIYLKIKYFIVDMFVR